MSEKLLDALVAKCVVFYYGCPPDRLKEYFNLDSIIPIEDFKEEMLTKKFYESKLKSIEDNYQRALKFDLIEDILFEKYLS